MTHPRRPKRRNDDKVLSLVENPLAEIAVAREHLQDARTIAEHHGDRMELANALRMAELHATQAAIDILAWSENYPYRRASV